jgi:hypothetical protein
MSGDSGAAKRQGAMASSSAAPASRPSAASKAPASLACGVCRIEAREHRLECRHPQALRPPMPQQGAASQVLPMSVPVPVINCALIFPPPPHSSRHGPRPDMTDWLTPGLAHLWLPYTQMQTAPAPLPVVASEGVRLRLADGRELIDGISSWWTACHGYNHPHIRAAVEAATRRPAPRDVRRPGA